MATCMLIARVQRCLLIPYPGLPEQPGVWNFLNFECLTLQEVIIAVWAPVPKHASHTLTILSIFSH